MNASGPGPLPDSPVPGMLGFTHQYAQVNGTRLHFVKGGSGPAVVLLHGWPFTWREWRPVMPLLAAGGFSVLAPDLRGLGDSDKPEGGYSKRNVAEDVHQLVHQLGIRELQLMGTDIGTMVAHAYATAYPREVHRLVLSESLLPGFGLEELMNPATGGYWHFGFHMQVELAEMLTSGKEAAYLGGMWKLMCPPPHPLSEEDRTEYLRTYAAPGGMRAGFRHYASLLEDGRANRAAAKRPLPMPVLVLCGDRGLPQAPLLDGVQRIARDVSADIVPDSGHVLGSDNPTWLAERLPRFFAPGSSRS